MFTSMNRPGQFYAEHRRRVMNRTGGSVVVGSVLALDVQADQTETQNGDGVGGISGLDVEDAIFHNVENVDAGNKDGMLVVVNRLLDGGGADDTEIEVVLCSQRVAVEVDSTTDIARGDRLKWGSADHLVKFTSAAADDRAVAIALQDRTSDDQGNIDAVFGGGIPFFGAYGS